ncbi:MAG: hypothetical protein KC496_11620 [Anaerolineae bacterium]|nr:hypothetical protein [Anaerolineae bacterium]
MSFNVEQHPSSRAVVVILQQDFSMQTEYAEFRAQVRAALDEHSQPTTLIFEVRDASLTSKDLLVATDGDSQDLLRHPNIRETIVVTEDMLVQIAAKGVNSFSFGYIKVRTFPTLEAALAYAEESSIN